VDGPTETYYKLEEAIHPLEQESATSGAFVSFFLAKDLPKGFPFQTSWLTAIIAIIHTKPLIEYTTPPTPWENWMERLTDKTMAPHIRGGISMVFTYDDYDRRRR
jgi:hypothetical protein